MEETELGTLHGSGATGTRHAEVRRLERGESVGRYVIVTLLGAGGMGVVYSAYDPELDRRVALKLLHPVGGGSKGSKGRARLVREAQALAKLNHPNVVTVHDVGEHEGRVFVAMEYVEGITLKAWMKRGPHPWPEVVDALIAAGRGLVAAHAKEMTHRDFKPDNVMFEGDGESRRVIVMDFGLATAPTLQTDADDFDASGSSSLASWARRHTWPPIAQLERGRSLLALARYDDSVEALENAYFGAMRSGYDTIASQAAGRLVSAYGDRLSDAKTGRRWARHATLLVQRSGSPLDQAILDIERARLEFSAAEFDKAQELGESAAEVFEREYGPYAEETLHTSELLLAVYDRLGRTEDAVSLARKALEARQQALGNHHPVTLSAHNNLSAALISVYAYEEAESHAHASLASQTQPDLETASRLDNLAIILSRTDRRDEALRLTARVLEIRRELLPKNHLRTAHTLVNRALLHFEAGNFEDAIEGALEAKEIYIQSGGPKVQYLVSPYRILGAASSELGRHQAAADSFSAAVEIMREALGAEHYETKKIVVELLMALVEGGDAQRALEVSQPLVEQEPTLDDLPAETLVPLYASSGRANLQVGNADLAKTQLERAIALADGRECCEDWAHVYEIELGRLRHMTGAKAEGIAEVRAALARLEAANDPTLTGDVERARAWLKENQPSR